MAVKRPRRLNVRAVNRLGGQTYSRSNVFGGQPAAVKRRRPTGGGETAAVKRTVPADAASDEFEETNNQEDQAPSSKKTCLICAQGNLPTELHTCIICLKPVHILYDCSYEIPGQEVEEGCGEKRICFECHHSKRLQVDKIIEDRTVENWRGQAVPPKKRAKFSFLVPRSELACIDFSSKSVCKPIGILKNGNVSVRPVIIDKKSVIVRNTCAYDSLLQVLACAFCDSPAYKNFVNDADIPAYIIAKNLASSLINAQTYRRRTSMLLLFCDVEELQNGVFEVK